MLIVSVVGILVTTASNAVTSAAKQQNLKADVVNQARSSLERVATLVRISLVSINSVTGTSMGTNLDLNDVESVPVLRDGFLFYFDANRTGSFVDLNGDDVVDNGGFDDGDGDGNADLYGLGLVAQDQNFDGIQDFIDTNNDGAADDVNGDGEADRLWRFVLVRFNNVTSVTNTALWRSGATLASNVVPAKQSSGSGSTGANFDTMQYSATGYVTGIYDSNADGILDETEIGNAESANGLIDTANEIRLINTITITVHVIRYDTVQKQLLRSDQTARLAPRVFYLMRTNNAIYQADPTNAAHIN
jgi:hypothetical protein